MKKSSRISPRIILSGGGTGGHIYPAIAIADEIRNRFPVAEILFVGAEDKMEMEKVPKAGYKIEGLWISGLQRDSMLKNITLPFKLISSLAASFRIIKRFRPDMVIGTGGFASGPVMYAAAKKGIPVLIQEQNSFPGITNKLMKNKAFAICTAYDNMEKFFPKENVHHTGNPIRSELFTNLDDQRAAKERFGLDPDKPLILSVGGSLGSRTLNNAWLEGIDDITENGIQLLWQTGKTDWERLHNDKNLKNTLIHLTEFIYNMNYAYAAADVIVSRAGAMAISELTLIGKPVILVPFPYAAEDHQTKNAENLVNHGAALMITDNEANEKLTETAIELIQNKEKQENLRRNIQQLAKPNATKDIVDLVVTKLNLNAETHI